jgi:hypothetical protein
VATATFVIVFSQSDAASQGVFPLVSQIIVSDTPRVHTPMALTLCDVQTLSPLLIIWRVAKGKAVSGTSMSAGSTSAVSASTRTDRHDSIAPGVPMHNLRFAGSRSHGSSAGDTTEYSHTRVGYPDAKPDGVKFQDV